MQKTSTLIQEKKDFQTPELLFSESNNQENKQLDSPSKLTIASILQFSKCLEVNKSSNVGFIETMKS